jgi:hypothetical protein
MNRQRHLIIRLRCLVHAVLQLSTALGLCLLAAVTTNAQQITGVPGSPDATVTIDGKQIPPPPIPFGGTIKESAKDSKPWWPPRVVPPKGAPNVLLIMTDDQGYGVSGTFGGVIPTPALDRIAKAGLRYTEFHSTALCSPTRAALITGRNHHSVGYGVIGELSTGYPGYDSVIGPESATIGTILRDNGYATSWFGKNHNTPTYQYSEAGPFDQWPVGMGFQYFYGFMGGETGYNLTTDLVDDAISESESHLGSFAPPYAFQDDPSHHTKRSSEASAWSRSDSAAARRSSTAARAASSPRLVSFVIASSSRKRPASSRRTAGAKPTIAAFQPIASAGHVSPK